jgi:hypothetical protein
VHLAYIALALALIMAAALYIRSRATQRGRNRDPIEYYRGFAGYQFQLPLRLTGKIAKEEAEALAATGHPYYVGYYGPNGRLLKAVKMLGGTMNFEHAYLYSTKGRLMSAAIARADGTMKVLGGGGAKDASVLEHCVRSHERAFAGSVKPENG